MIAFNQASGQGNNSIIQQGDILFSVSPPLLCHEEQLTSLKCTASPHSNVILYSTAQHSTALSFFSTRFIHSFLQILFSALLFLLR